MDQGTDKPVTYRQTAIIIDLGDQSQILVRIIGDTVEVDRRSDRYGRWYPMPSDSITIREETGTTV